jgi:phage head maturation protease
LLKLVEVSVVSIPMNSNATFSFIKSLKANKSFTLDNSL